MLSSDIGEISLLAPSLTACCPGVKSAPFSTEVVLTRDEAWKECLQSRFFVYPLHASGTFLMTPDTSSALYLAAMCLLRRDYERCCAIAPACRTDLPLNVQEAWALQQLWKSEEDKHPDAHACRIRFAAIEKEAEGEEAALGAGRQSQEAMAAGLGGWIVDDEVLGKDFAGYGKKEQSISAFARLSPQEQLDVHRLFEVKGDRTKYLAVLSKVVARQERIDEEAELKREHEQQEISLGPVGASGDEMGPPMVRRQSSLRLERSEQHSIALHAVHESAHPFAFDTEAAAKSSDGAAAEGGAGQGNLRGTRAAAGGAAGGAADAGGAKQRVSSVQKVGFSSAD